MKNRSWLEVLAAATWVAIFFDTPLSDPPGQACGSCHDPLVAFSGSK